MRLIFVCATLLAACAARPAMVPVTEATSMRPAFTCPEHGGPAWSEVQTAHFTVYSDAGPSAATRIAGEAESIYATLEDLAGIALPTTPRTSPRIRVVAFARPVEYRKVAMKNTVGEFMPDGNGVDGVPTLLVHGGRLSFDVREVLQHELTHSLLHRSVLHPPLWLNEGLAEYMSSITVERGMAIIGRKPARLRGRRLNMPIPRASEAMAASPGRFRTVDLQEGYYIASWGLVHRLNHASPEHRTRFRHYLQLLANGAPQETAWQTAFDGFDLSTLDEEVRIDIGQKATKVYEGPYQARDVQLGAARTLSDAQVHLLWLKLRHWNQANRPAVLADLAEAHRQAPMDPEVLFARATALQWFRHPLEAEQVCRRALEEHPDEPRYLRLLITTLVNEALLRPGGAERFESLREPLARFAAVATEARELIAAASVYLALSEVETATPLAARALKADPACIECLVVMATIAMTIDRPADAALLQERALQLLPEDAPTAKALALLDRYKAAAARKGDAPVAHDPLAELFGDEPRGDTAAPRMVASFTLTESQRRHDLPHLPEAFKEAHAHQTLKGLYEVCIGRSGRVFRTRVRTSIGDAAVDDAIVQQLRSGWTYRALPEPVCSVFALQFNVN